LGDFTVVNTQHVMDGVRGGVGRGRERERERERESDFTAAA